MVNEKFIFRKKSLDRLQFPKWCILPCLPLFQKMLFLSWKKLKIDFYGQIKKVKLNTQHCNDYKNEGLKNVDIELKIISLKCSWICRLYNEVDRDWKIIPLNYIHNTLRKIFTFHSNLSIPIKTLIPLPPFYKDISKSWCSSFFLFSKCSFYFVTVLMVQFIFENW